MKKPQSLKRKLNSLKCKDRVEILWHDACGPGDAKWHDEEEFQEYLKETLVVKDLGYVMSIDCDSVNIVGGFAESDTYETIYHREIKIPVGCIKEVKRL